MYIPTAISLFQVALSPFARLLDLGSQHGGAHLHDLNRLAVLSPYHDRAPVPGVRAELPADCTVDQVMLLHRHGSRGPEWEKVYIDQLVETLNASSDAIPHAHLPPNFWFLKDGYESHLNPEALTVIGRQQLFDHGVELALQYPGFTTGVVLSSPVQRVVDSSHYFGHGFFGGNVDDVQFGTVDDLDVPVNWIMPWKSCPKYNDHEARKGATTWSSKYVPPITQRLNHILRGVGLSDDDVRGALYACPYDLAAHGESPWCSVFHTHELRGLEYEYDVYMDVLTGHISINDMGPLLGSVYVNKLIERFSNATGDAQELYLEFGHDTSILLVLSALGLNKDATPLPVDHVRVRRKFRTSEQTPFAAKMVWEKFTCKKSFDGPQIRLLLNSETYPLTLCRKSFKDFAFGTCSLSEFVKANDFSTNIRYGNEVWNAVCGQYTGA